MRQPQSNRWTAFKRVPADCPAEAKPRRRRKAPIYPSDSRIPKHISELASERPSWALDALRLTCDQHSRSVVLTRLEQAANAKREADFIGALEGAQWDSTPAADFVRAIGLALKAGAYLAARQISDEAIKQHPDDSELREYARALSPPKVVSRDVPSQPSFQANREWLNKYAQQHSGKWVALRNGELLGLADSFDELFERIGRSKEVLFTRA